MNVESRIINGLSLYSEVKTGKFDGLKFKKYWYDLGFPKVL